MCGALLCFCASTLKSHRHLRSQTDGTQHTPAAPVAHRAVFTPTSRLLAADVAANVVVNREAGARRRLVALSLLACPACACVCKSALASLTACLSVCVTDAQLEASVRWVSIAKVSELAAASSHIVVFAYYHLTRSLTSLTNHGSIQFCKLKVRHAVEFHRLYR